MALTLLLDLDNTLLGNEMDTFLPAYLQALSGHLSSYVDPDRMIAALLDGTRRMAGNQDPGCLLEEVFDDVFYPAIGIEKATIRPVIDSFYEQVFPSLQSLTQFRPKAVRLVDAALSRGYQIAIATNPLFPRSASLQRLAWAGFDPAKYPFKLVSTYEDFHFAKPNSAYYAEVLAALNWPDGPVLMVGDDLDRDIIPAHQLGLSTFWIRSPNKPRLKVSSPPARAHWKTCCPGWMSSPTRRSNRTGKRHPLCWRPCGPRQQHWIACAVNCRQNPGRNARQRINGAPRK